MNKNNQPKETKDLYGLDACYTMARYAQAIGNEDSSMSVTLEDGTEWCVSVVKVVQAKEGAKEDV